MSQDDAATVGIPPHRTQHLTQTDLARRWRISPRTLERWRYLRFGPNYIKVGGRIVYLLADIQAYEEAHRR
jgi:hypothetical protein